MKVLNLGCGTLNRISGEIGYDIDPSCKPDVRGDCSDLPFKDDTFDEVHSIHVLEHIRDIVRTMDEVYRVLCEGGRFHIRVPLFPSIGSISDPTHVRFFVPETFGYFVRDGALPELKHKWKMGGVNKTDTEIYCVLRKT